MERLHEQDTIISHRILNYLHAGYHGEYSYMKALQELGSPEVNDEALKRVDTTLQRIIKWYEGLSKGDCLFSAAWKSPQTFEARKAIEFLESLRAIFLRQSQTMREIAASDDWQKSKDKTRKAAANIVRSAISSSQFAHGAIDLSRVTNKLHVVKDAPLMLKQSEAALARASHCISIIKGVGKIPPELTTEFVQDVFQVAGTLASQAHDILQLLALYNGNEAYILKSFDPAVIEAWKKIGVSATEAGYWLAFGFTPETAKSWIDGGLHVPGIAAMWQAEKFPMEEAGQWASIGLSPASAIAWKTAGYMFNEAAAYIKKGFLTPSELPKGE